MKSGWNQESFIKRLKQANNLEIPCLPYSASYYGRGIIINSCCKSIFRFRLITPTFTELNPVAHSTIQHGSALLRQTLNDREDDHVATPEQNRV